MGGVVEHQGGGQDSERGREGAEEGEVSRPALVEVVADEAPAEDADEGGRARGHYH